MRTLIVPEASVTLRNPTGLHARPAKLFAQAAAGFLATVTVGKGERQVNGKSVLSILTLDCHQGDEIVIHTEGDGAEEALVGLVALLESGLSE
jgi:phosphocarrier protein HPr